MTDDEAQARRVRAGIGLATSFGAWQWLVRQEQLAEDEATELLARSVEAGAGPSAPSLRGLRARRERRPTRPGAR